MVIHTLYYEHMNESNLPKITSEYGGEWTERKFSANLKGERKEGSINCDLYERNFSADDFTEATDFSI